MTQNSSKETTYEIVADVTREQYEYLMNGGATTCRMTVDLTDGDNFFYTENEIPQFIKAAVFKILESGDDESIGRAFELEEMDVEHLVPGVRQVANRSQSQHPRVVSVIR